MENESSTVVQPPVLSAEHVTKSFAGNRVLDDVDLSCHAGQVHALLGANGAGKSTLIQIMTGVYQPDGGALRLGGEQVRFHHPADAVKSGVAAVYQELSLVDDLDVAENVFLGMEPRKGGAVLDRRALYAQCTELFAQHGIDIDPRLPVASLSLARRQLVELAKALARNAKLVILDEPTAALTASEQELLFTTLTDLRRRGTAIVYVSHRLEEIFRIADWVTVLRDGRVVTSAPTSDLNRDRVIEAMVGGKLAAARSSKVGTGARGSPRAPVLEVDGLSGQKFADVSFTVRPGEIVGIAGLIGSGRSSLLGALFGVYRTTSGSVRVDGKPVDLRSVRHAVQAGIALVTEDRKRTGLALDLTIHQNLSSVRLASRFGVYRRRTVYRRAREVAKQVSLTRDIRHRTKVLSGGNQQKVVLGKWLTAKPRVLLCDEPTRGIDVGARADLYRLLLELAESGVAIVVASSDLDEVLTVTSRVLVMAHGQIVDEFETASATEEGLMRAATGTGTSNTPSAH